MLHLISIPNILTMLLANFLYILIIPSNEVIVQAYSNIYRRTFTHVTSISKIIRKYELKLSSSSTSDTTVRGNEYRQQSFIQDELRPYAMKLHTRDQAPKEGQQKAQVHLFN